MITREFTRILSFKGLKAFDWGLIFLVFILVHIPAIRNSDTQDNFYVILAKSLVKGELTVQKDDLPFVPGTHIRNTGDLIFYQGKYYLPYPPAPSLLLIPFILTGANINSVLIAVILSCLNIFLLVSIFNKLKVKEDLIPWLVIGCIFGTSYWFVLLSSHHVYGFAEIVAVTATLLFLNELLGKSRSLLLGLFLGIAFLSRQFTIFLGLFGIGYFIYRYLLIPGLRDRKLFWRKLNLFLLTLGGSIFLYFLYNYARFGNPLDPGYVYINFIGVLKERVDQYGVFSIHYVLYNLYSYLLKGFNIEFAGNGLIHIQGMDLFGSALLVASPFLVAAFKSGWHKWLRIFAWITIGVIFTGLLFYHNNGEEQVNSSRFTLDFLPLMFLLTGLGAEKLPPWLFKAMVIYALLINLIAFTIHFRYHTLKQ